ncbi:major facilitator superfamily domain-containing protein [Stachybotrys elegans]|uniref:Major facilitator superfamily domain-containing protein n=1 Tax=Stachybotrys elegans TaxID=80388 RepID=A0A8K0SFY7_9HYPO|nr:major facilitator superfamily domain-containing protein [Stachybotrys elegans]
MAARESQDGPTVTWDQDPNNAQNWRRWKKAINLGIVTVLAFLPPLESSVIVPAVPLLRDDYGDFARPILSLVVSIFVLGFAIGPIILAPLSELYGRRPILHLSNVASLAFTIASAMAPNIASFIVFRFIAGSFSSGPMNIAGGSIADQVSLQRRELVMSIFFAGIFIGPVVGPVIGGFVAQDLGWRWIFWLMAIVKVLMTIVTFLCLSESHPDIIQQRLAKNNTAIDGRLHTRKIPLRTLLLRSISRPLRMLVQSPIVTGLSLYLALIYGYLYLLFTTFSTVFPNEYGFGTDTLGLSFLGIGVGCMVALAILSWLSDSLQARLTTKNKESKPEYRLVPIVLGVPLIPISLLGYGWTVEYHVHWAVPIFFTGLAGAGLIFSFLPTQVYVVDAFTKHAASAMAATSIIRSIFGACIPLAGLPLYSTLGYGWGNSLLGFIAIAMSIAPLVLWRYGEILRSKYVIEFD